MFSVRRISPRIFTVLAVAALGIVALAIPASAHTSAFTRDCDSVTVNLTSFAQSSQADPNVVDVYRDGTKIDSIQFTGSSTSKNYDQSPTGSVTLETKWNHTGSDNQSGSKKATLEAPSGCAPPCVQDGAFSYTFDGATGKAVVTLTGETPLCTPVTVLLASFKTEGATWETSGHQTVFDQVSQQITTPGTYPLSVDVPNCFTQVDLYVTDKRAVDFDFPNDTLGKYLASTVWPKAGPFSAWNGGTTSCVEATPTPTPTPTATAPASTVPPAPAQPGNSLPNTGASPTPKILLAVLLLSVGTGLVLIGRRRRTVTG